MKPTLKEVLQEHARLAPDDGRVKLDPITGLFKGEHFDLGDPLHQHALESVPDEYKSMLSRAQRAIAAKEPLYLSYKSSQANPAIIPSRESREAEQGQERDPDLKGHGILPTAIGVTFGKKAGEPNRGFIQGISGSVAASNAQHLNDALGKHSSYPDLDHPKFGSDLQNYISNLRNGWTGDGSERIKGTPEHPVKQTKGYEPFRLKPEEADYLNAILHNVAAKGKGTSAAIAQGLAHAQGGGLLSEAGETNPLRHKIDSMGAGAKRTWYPGMPEEPEKPWTEEMLEPTIRHFNTDKIGELHEFPSEMPEHLRPPIGTERVHQAFSKQGLPPKDVVAANPRGGAPPGPGEVL